MKSMTSWQKQQHKTLCITTTGCLQAELWCKNCIKKHLTPSKNVFKFSTTLKIKKAISAKWYPMNLMILSCKIMS